jgi:hypothetical protein
LVAAVLWGLAVAIFTEVLSLWHALNFWGVLLSSMALSGLLAWLGWRGREELAKLSLVTAVPLSAVGPGMSRWRCLPSAGWLVALTFDAGTCSSSMQACF